ncbi:hypothetical protein [Symmachiella dynata]|uniref:hypothetical protein n=1 Tax=Symmachiella dynata TaxID=2527995 RepID=UPI0030EDAFA7
MPKSTIAIVTFVASGQEAAYIQCTESIKRAYQTNNGGFANLIALRIDDHNGTMSVSQARNLAVGAAASRGADWVLCIDANDLLAANALGDIKPFLDEYDGIWGQLYTFQEGSSEAIKREPQIDQTESFTELLNYRPEASLQSGHMLRTSVAQQFLHDESLSEGHEFDQFLRVWEQARCVKIPHPISLHRIDGNESEQNAVAKRVLTKYRIKHGATEGTAPQEVDYGMDFTLFGLIGCGTREIAELMTIPNQRIILDEPAILGHEWARHVHTQLRKCGIEIDEQDWTRKNYLTFQEFFDVQVLPKLAAIPQWGLRTTRLEGWQQLLETYPPRNLVLCVRDIRDVVLSHVDVALRMGIPIDGSFVEHRTRTSAAALMEISQRPHILVRYEELAAPGGMQRLSETLGVEIPGPAGESVPLADGPAERHLLERRPELVAFVNRVWSTCDDYCRTFGYERPGTASQNQVA